MATTTWNRSFQAQTNYDLGTVLLCSIPSGSTYRRVRFSWGFVAATPTLVDIENITFAIITLGLVTTIGNGSETVPNAVTAAHDAAPPTQRWIWWESRVPVVSAMSNAAGMIVWRDSGPQEPTDTRSQVLATGIPGGDSLNLWASWAAGYDPWVTAPAMVWVSASVLYSTP
jgi:hypothetical protein